VSADYIDIADFDDQHAAEAELKYPTFHGFDARLVRNVEDGRWELAVAGHIGRYLLLSMTVNRLAAIDRTLQIMGRAIYKLDTALARIDGEHAASTEQHGSDDPVYEMEHALGWLERHPNGEDWDETALHP
jgi:hypothetical protein